MKNLYIQPQVATMAIESTSALCVSGGGVGPEPTPTPKTLQVGGAASQQTEPIRFF